MLFNKEKTSKFLPIQWYMLDTKVNKTPPQEGGGVMYLLVSNNNSYRGTKATPNDGSHISYIYLLILPNKKIKQNLS